MYSLLSWVLQQRRSVIRAFWSNLFKDYNLDSYPKLQKLITNLPSGTSAWGKIICSYCNLPAQIFWMSLKWFNGSILQVHEMQRNPLVVRKPCTLRRGITRTVSNHSIATNQARSQVMALSPKMHCFFFSVKCQSKSTNGIHLKNVSFLKVLKWNYTKWRAKALRAIGHMELVMTCFQKNILEHFSHRRHVWHVFRHRCSGGVLLSPKNTYFVFVLCLVD